MDVVLCVISVALDMMMINYTISYILLQLIIFFKTVVTVCESKSM